MTQIDQIYKCNICGNIVEMTHAGAGELVCCGQPMELQIEKTRDVGAEKHVPILEKTAEGYKIKVGSVPHPMEEAHYIEWIELIYGEKICRRRLKPGEPAEMEVNTNLDNVYARAYCNIHGLWRN
ncbi:MAG: desulfoferrodoxin [Patescibacteria group bacterium]|nr:desulfoferrodoxin [Patescibacteria group bacterium]MDD4610696.1 desulfoferrodoxin [Patescibacteria group bacterium]